MSFHLPDIAPMRQRLADVDAQLEKPDTFKDKALLSSLSREHQLLSNTIQHHQTITQLQQQLNDLEGLLTSEEDEAMRELMLQEKTDLNQRLESEQQALLLAMIPPDPNDSRNTILEIRAGTGGEEAALFAGDLYRMYTRFAEQQHWHIEVQSCNESDSGGFKEIIVLIQGEQVYKMLKYEGGGHRVQRIPVTEANGRIHTSSATVAVLPEAQEVEIAIRPEDLDITVCRASGAGGQHVNKTESAVQIIHKPTGMIVTCANERSQQKNREQAMRVLRSRLLSRKQAEEAQAYAKERKDQVGSGDRSDRIRTYNFPQNRVTDHRLNMTTYNLDKVLEGNLLPFIEAAQNEDNKRRIAAFLHQTP